MAVALLAVSSSAWVVRFLPDTSAITLAFWRMFLASAMVFILSYKTLTRFVPNKKILLAGIFLGIHFALFFRAVQLTSIAEAALLGTTAPIFTEIYGFLFKRKKPVVMVLVGLFVAFLGAGTLVSQSSFSETSSLGNIFAVFCSVAMALVLILGKEVRKETPVFEYTRWLFFFAATTLFFISLLFDVSVFSFTLKEFCWFLFLALVPTMVGHNIFYYLIKKPFYHNCGGRSAGRACCFFCWGFLFVWRAGLCCCGCRRKYYSPWGFSCYSLWRLKVFF